jgi:alanine racemase
MSTAPDARPTWADVDLGAFRRNVDAVARMLPDGSRLVAVLKANAYGHGAIEVARACDSARVAMIATALLEESLALRNAGITLPLLVFGPQSEAGIRSAMDHDIVVGIIGPEELAAAVNVARGRDVVVHIKLDSGMNRMGLTSADLGAARDLIRSASRLKVAAIYTHFANAGDPDDPFTRTQIETFHAMRTALGIDAPLHHAANSAATVRGLVEPGDFVRCGIVLYGADPLDRCRTGDLACPGQAGLPVLQPVLRWRTEIARLKTVPPGAGIGYGTTFHTTRESRIATLPVGYADGYDRLLSNRGEVVVRGVRAPVVGRVSMDLVTIDVTDVPNAALGDEVVLLGDELRVEEHAAWTGTIAYEVFCRISARVPRFYRS